MKIYEPNLDYTTKDYCPNDTKVFIDPRVVDYAFWMLDMSPHPNVSLFAQGIKSWTSIATTQDLRERM